MVLFTSVRPLERAENLKAVYDAYDGEKEYVRTTPNKPIPDLHSGKYTLQVGDELPTETPGKFIFIGHGMGAGKLYGIQRKWFHHTELITYAIASSNAMVPYVSTFTGLDESHIIPLGMPRTDAYLDVKEPNPEPIDFLYAPTFRTGHWQPYWDSLQEYMNPEDLMIVKAHMVTGRIVPRTYRNIIECDCMYPSTPHLKWCDVLITDYSSIMFDAFVLRKPVVLFAKDKAAYLKARGMYCKYPEDYSELFCDTEKVLMYLTHRAKWNDRFEQLREFYAGACDGKSTSRVIDLIRSLI